MTLPDHRSTAPASRRRWIVSAVAVIALCAVAVTAVWLRGGETPQAASDPSVTAPTATPTIAASPAPATTAAASPAPVAAVEARSPVTMRVPSVEIDASVLPTAFQDGVIDPPTFEEAYWIEAYGAPGPESDNTVYLVGHSSRNGDAVFNPLFDEDSQTSNVAPGDEIVVSTPEGDVTYEIERTERYPKETLGNPDSDGYTDVWKVVPGRLILVTCFQRDDGAASQDNFVVYATLAD